MNTFELLPGSLQEQNGVLPFINTRGKYFGVQGRQSTQQRVAMAPAGPETDLHSCSAVLSDHSFKTWRQCMELLKNRGKKAEYYWWNPQNKLVFKILCNIWAWNPCQVPLCMVVAPSSLSLAFGVSLGCCTCSCWAHCSQFMHFWVSLRQIWLWPPLFRLCFHFKHPIAKYSVLSKKSHFWFWLRRMCALSMKLCNTTLCHQLLGTRFWICFSRTFHSAVAPKTKSLGW